MIRHFPFRLVTKHLELWLWLTDWLTDWVTDWWTGQTPVQDSTNLSIFSTLYQDILPLHDSEAANRQHSRYLPWVYSEKSSRGCINEGKERQRSFKKNIYWSSQNWLYSFLGLAFTLLLSFIPKDLIIQNNIMFILCTVCEHHKPCLW